MEGATSRDDTQDWLLPAGSAPPLMSELEHRVDEALAIAKASEAAVMTVGAAASNLVYDAQGHLVQKGAQTFAFDRSDLLLGTNGETYRYDADGRRTVIGVNGEQRISIYDHDGRLLTEVEPGLAVGCKPANDRIFCHGFEH